MKTKDDDTFFDEGAGTDNAEENLLALLNEFDRPAPTRFSPGDKVHGTVSRIGSDTLFVDAGTRSEATMSLNEVRDAQGNLTVAVGDSIEAYVRTARGENLELSTSFSSRTADTGELIEAMKSSIPVEGKVTGINKGGLQVKVLGKQAFCPVSHIELQYVDDVNVYLGRSMQFVIARVAEGGRTIVLTRHPILEEQLAKRLDELEALAGSTTTVSGTITRITDFGLFVDCGGVEGLVHISEVSWGRSENLAASWEAGQQVTCMVQNVQRREPLRTSRISLSIRLVSADPWETMTQRYAPGAQASGVVTRCAPFGAFVELEPGIEGLVHISEMSWERRVNHPGDIVQSGQRVDVTVLGVDTAKKTISLSLKNLEADPWRGVAGRYGAGTTVGATVASQTRFGYFVDLAPGLTGLLPFGAIAPGHKEALTIGAAIEVTIASVDEENRRISLSLGLDRERAQEEGARAFIEQRAAEEEKKEPAVSEFGASLLAALKAKN